ncbi:hypothetical protein H4R33_002034 [Dimargaris cristalligena]|nr:hypothetical protein H4R33_002034 [Dimargaris cristalligena]
MIPLQEPGQGHIHCGLVAGQPTLFQCSGKYPLKLVAPRVHHHPVTAPSTAVPGQKSHPKTIASSAAAAVYILTYGGGIVHGDRINLSVQVDPGAVLTLLTQGSTKVFRNRDGEALQPEVPPELSVLPAPASKGGADSSKDTRTSTVGGYGYSPPTPLAEYSLNQLTATVAPGGCLVCLPSPVTCFKESRYLQNQRIELQDATSGLVLLDWMTSGRHSCGESWQFDLYNSTNTIYLGGTLLLKDAVHLSDKFRPPSRRTATTITHSPTSTCSDPASPVPSPPPASDDPVLTRSPEPLPGQTPCSYAERMSPHSCFAMLTILGQRFGSLIDHLQAFQKQDTISAHRPGDGERQDRVSAQSSDSSAQPPAARTVIYTMSPVTEAGATGLVIRLSASTTEAITEWIKWHLTDLQSLVGVNIWKSVLL